MTLLSSHSRNLTLRSIYFMPNFHVTLPHRHATTFLLKLTLHIWMDVSDRNLVRALFPWRLPFTCTFTVLDYVHQVQKHFFIFLPFFSQHVYALQQLENHLTEGACALDVGSGSGFLTAAMAYMVKKKNSTVDKILP